MRTLLLATLVSFSAFASECADVSLYDDPQSPLKKIPIYDQDGDGSCYAYTASQMIDFHNLKKNPQHKLSNALWIAFAHKARNRGILKNFWSKLTHPRRTFGVSNPNELGFSDLSLTLHDLRKVGICDEEIVRAGIRDFRVSDKLNDDEFLYLFNLVANQVNQLRKRDPYIEESDKQRIFDIALNDLIEQRDSDILDPEEKLRTIASLNTLRMRPQLSCGVEEPSTEARELFERIMAVMDYEKKTKQLEILKDKVFSKCFEQGATVPVEVPKVKHVGEMYAGNDRILAAIDTALDQKQAPAGIGYCSKTMDSPDQTPALRFSELGFPPKPRVLKLAKKENVQRCSPHYSVVVGRRNRGGQCQYLIRNTYGAHFWNKYMDCTCELDGKRFDCNYGTHGHLPVTVLGCWIKGENLAESSFSVSYFE